MSVEELMRTRETIGDLIAEKEMQELSATVEVPAAETRTRKRDALIGRLLVYIVFGTRIATGAPRSFISAVDEITANGP